MKKKAIIILLLLPFIIALFAFITTTYLIRDVEQDITDIQFDYEANQYFDLSDGMLNRLFVPDDSNYQALDRLRASSLHFLADSLR